MELEGGETGVNIIEINKAPVSILGAMRSNGINTIKSPTTNEGYSLDDSTKFMCDSCKKIFDNAVALCNHKNMYHDGEGLDDQFDSKSFDQSLCSINKFRFVPYNHNEDSISRCGVLIRTLIEDTTYLIVKSDMNATNINSRSDGSRKGHAKEFVDLRGPFTCTIPSLHHPEVQCHQVFFKCCDYSRHYRDEHTKRRKSTFRCQVCEKPLDKDFYKNTLTPIPFTYDCRLCQHTFLDNASFDEHNRLFHMKLKPYQCTRCDKRFTQQGGLHQHMRMHSGIRPFTCTFCTKAFTQKAGLDQHLRTHTKIKPFKCIICSKTFSQLVHLRQHMRTHTNIQPFECSICGRRFKQSSHLNFHMRSHVSDGSLAIEAYTQSINSENQMDLFGYYNFQPIQGGELIYYSSESVETSQPTPCMTDSQVTVSENVSFI